MKKFFSVILLLFTVVSATFCLTACNEKEPDKQITILQIYDAISEQKSNLSGLENAYIREGNYASTSLMLQNELEIRNIDTEEFMLGYDMSILPSSGPTCRIYFLKFRFSDNAKNCVEKLGPRETISKTITLNFKQYGNLVIGVDDDFYQQIFEIIDKI